VKPCPKLETGSRSRLGLPQLDIPAQLGVELALKYQERDSVVTRMPGAAALAEDPAARCVKFVSSRARLILDFGTRSGAQDPALVAASGRVGPILAFLVMKGSAVRIRASASLNQVVWPTKEAPEGVSISCLSR
jgi:hypothetical protein